MWYNNKSVMGVFSKPKPKVNEWFLTGCIDKYNKVPTGAFLYISNFVDITGGKKRMHHVIYVNALKWAEIEDSIDVYVEICVTGEVFYGTEGVFNRAKEVEVL